MKFSLIIPVYKNEESLSRLLEVLADMSLQLNGELEAIFVVDGSPDQSFTLLRDELGRLNFPAQLLLHSRNFGSFPAIRSGLSVARGDYFGVMAADLQEPPELIVDFFKTLSSGIYDVVIGTRSSRNDPLISKLMSGSFWRLYRKLVVPEMPIGGVDVFGCNKIFREKLIELDESRSSLIALIFWLGFRRKQIDYVRAERKEGKSSWTFSKKIDYMLDSVFAFTDYPIRLLMRIGLIGCILSLILGSLVFLGYISGRINVPGYSATILVVLFLGMLNLLGLGIVGTYAWRAYENSKGRPLAIISSINVNNKL